MALVSHLATLRASLPFVHFFDGFRTRCVAAHCDAVAAQPSPVLGWGVGCIGCVCIQPWRGCNASLMT